MNNELKIKNEKILKNQLIEALTERTGLDKDNYDLFENVKVEVNNHTIIITEQDLKNYFEIQSEYRRRMKNIRRKIRQKKNFEAIAE
ncbi:hypothetical protein [Brachyspira catarrhinii]|uniref:Uncharacterized protein n=1 Tax=Brachyspira catarrhinii TaxID=2528966 RepID=A0ABY2TN99_9SPIR|nr:hypothetical protein [Brachyspira catarrhinii]TKZ29732.1 hypothetical protein EZH24_10850 [Brachyspira catarrhinii]